MCKAKDSPCRKLYFFNFFQKILDLPPCGSSIKEAQTGQ